MSEFTLSPTAFEEYAKHQAALSLKKVKREGERIIKRKLDLYYAMLNQWTSGSLYLLLKEIEAVAIEYEIDVPLDVKFFLLLHERARDSQSERDEV